MVRMIILSSKELLRLCLKIREKFKYFSKATIISGSNLTHNRIREFNSMILNTF